MKITKGNEGFSITLAIGSVILLLCEWELELLK